MSSFLQKFQALVAKPRARLCDITPGNSQVQWAEPAADRSSERSPASHSAIDEELPRAAGSLPAMVVPEQQSLVQTAATVADRWKG